MDNLDMSNDELDGLFSEGLQGMEVTPPPAVWEALDAGLLATGASAGGAAAGIKGAFWFKALLGGIAILGTSAIVYYAAQTNTNSLPPVADVAAEVNTSAPIQDEATPTNTATNTNNAAAPTPNNATPLTAEGSSNTNPTQANATSDAVTTSSTPTETEQEVDNNTTSSPAQNGVSTEMDNPTAQSTQLPENEPSSTQNPIVEMQDELPQQQQIENSEPAAEDELKAFSPTTNESNETATPATLPSLDNALEHNESTPDSNGEAPTETDAQRELDPFADPTFTDSLDAISQTNDTVSNTNPIVIDGQTSTAEIMSNDTVPSANTLPNDPTKDGIDNENIVDNAANPEGEIPNILYRFYLSVGAATQWTKRLYEQEENNLPVQYSSSYFATNESFSATVSPVFNLSFDFNHKFALQAGIGFYRTKLATAHDVVYFLEDDDEEEEEDMEFVTSSGTTLLSGHDFLPADAEEEEEYVFNLSGTEELRYLFIPLDARYTFFNRKVKLYGQTGISLHVLLEENTELAVENDFGQTFNTTKNNVEGLRGHRFGYQLAVGMQVPMNHHFTMYVEPQLRGGFGYINNTEDIETHQTLLGINTGLMFHF